MQRTLLSALMLGAALGAQDPGKAPVADPFGPVQQWLVEYKSGAIRFQKDGRTDQAVVDALQHELDALAATDTLAAAQLLFDLAVIVPPAGAGAGTGTSTEAIDAQRELQPWRVQAMAQKALRTMQQPDILPWLLQKLRGKGVRAKDKNQDQVEAAAVLRILAGHPSLEAKLELMQACGSMPDELRVIAVNSMGQDAQLELLPVLLDLLRDKEPNVRIAAANAIGRALQPHVDETEGNNPTGELLKQRDQAIDRLEKLLCSDKVWQVRSAAAFALGTMRCKAVIPALIRGLDAEVKNKKDPWAMDVRLHKLLEGLTGQSVARGGAAPWQAFWKAEGASFTVRPKPKPGEQAKADSRYAKFFDLELDSDRVLFVLDFSGSMAEPVTIRPQGTTAGGAGGTTTTKAQLVVEEIKKLVMALPDGALVNFVVFSDEVRIWRAEGAHPALVKLDDTTRDDLLGNFLDGLRPNGPTNLYDALDAALGFGGRGLYDKYYAAGFDTLYVITDGAPTAGPVTDQDEIRKRVREQNALRKVAIHCITFGDQNDTRFLEPLAEENGGRYIHIE